MPLDLIGIGYNFSPKAYDQTAPAAAPALAQHRFFETDDHQLGHEIDGELRAIVPPKGWSAYAEQWPDCAPLVAVLTKK